MAAAGAPFDVRRHGSRLAFLSCCVDFLLIVLLRCLRAFLAVWNELSITCSIGLSLLGDGRFFFGAPASRLGQAFVNGLQVRFCWILAKLFAARLSAFAGVNFVVHLRFFFLFFLLLARFVPGFRGLLQPGLRAAQAWPTASKNHFDVVARRSEDWQSLLRFPHLLHCRCILALLSFIGSEGHVTVRSRVNPPQFIKVAVGVRLPVHKAILGSGIWVRRIDSLPSQECAFIKVFESTDIAIVDGSENYHFECAEEETTS